MQLAKESKSVKKVRKKLKLHLKHAQTKTNKIKLKQISLLLRKQLEKPQFADRKIQEKMVLAFDENKNSAPIKNPFIAELKDKIEKELTALTKRNTCCKKKSLAKAAAIPQKAVRAKAPRKTKKNLEAKKDLAHQ